MSGIELRQLANLINEHALYCQNEYQPSKLPHLTLEKALAFMNEMQQSLTHFAMWLDTVKNKESHE